MIKANGDNEKLLNYLLFKAPAPNVETNESLFAFDRSREVDVRWDNLIDDEDDQADRPYNADVDGSLGLKYRFGSIWGLKDPLAPTADELVLLEALVQEKSSANWKIDTTTETNGRQTYLFIARVDEAFDLDHFSSAQKYDEFWKRVETAELIQANNPEMEEMDLSPAIILRQFRELKDQEKLGTKLDTTADTLLENAVQGFMSTDQINTLTAQYMGMKSVLDESQFSLRRLKDRASDLGYILNITDKSIDYKYPDEKDPFSIEPGELYTAYRTRIHWKTQHTRVRIRRKRSWFRTRISISRIRYSISHSKVVTKYAQKMVDFDPWVERENEFRMAGLHSYRFERTDEGYKTLEGDSFESVLQRCEMDRNFWDKCVVWIPVYEQSLTRGEILSRYLIIRRPMRGQDAHFMPQLFLDERISYRRSRAVEVELGELAHTISLAPGEQRKITTVQSESREEITTSSARSLVDLMDSSSSDFASEFEKEASKETQTSSSSKWSAKASGSYGAFSGSASAGGTSSKSVKRFARDLQKVARKAARNTTRKSQEEINSSTSLKTASSRNETNVIEIENANVGRSLNLAFYRLHNLSKMALFLDDLQFLVFSGKEVIAGSGIYLPEVYSLDQLRSVIAAMSLKGFPLETRVPKGGKKEKAEDDAQNALAKEILIALIYALSDYFDKSLEPRPGEAADETHYAEKLDEEVATLDNLYGSIEELEKLLKTVKAITPTNAGADEEIEKAINDIEKFILSFTSVSRVIEPSLQKLRTGNAGFYLDTFVGARPGLDDYAERARNIEIELNRSEVDLNRARAEQIRAGLPEGMEVQGSASNVNKTLKLVFLSAPPKGTFKILVKDQPVSTFESDGDLEQTVTFKKAQDWLTSIDTSDVRIIHVETSLTFHVVKA